MHRWPVTAGNARWPMPTSKQASRPMEVDLVLYHRFANVSHMYKKISWILKARSLKCRKSDSYRHPCTSYMMKPFIQAWWIKSMLTHAFVQQHAQSLATMARGKTQRRCTAFGLKVNRGWACICWITRCSQHDPAQCEDKVLRRRVGWRKGTLLIQLRRCPLLPTPVISLGISAKRIPM